MPTYDYECEKCGAVFEYMQSMNDEPLKVCPKDLCPQTGTDKGTGAVHRRIGSSGLMFKGSGFYITDYKKGGGGEKKGE
jgi:putative FmdB family regulatory protein